MAAGRIKVWDRPVRLLHWVLVVAVLMAWITTLTAFSAHQAAGYVALAAVLLRAVWGCVGSRYARFAQFVRPPRATLAYAHATLHKREPRFIGHNPLGGWMVVKPIWEKKQNYSRLRSTTSQLMFRQAQLYLMLPAR